MNHQPYEDWVFYENDLLKDEVSDREYGEFQNHLKNCPHCQSLSAAWRELENEIKISPQVSPEPGFTRRWMVRLEHNCKQTQRLQTIATLLVTTTGALVFLGLLVFTFLPWLANPNVYIYSFLYRFTKIYSYLNVAQEIAGVLFNTTTSLIPVSWWILLVGLVCELGVLWFVFYRILTFPRRIFQ